MSSWDDPRAYESEKIPPPGALPVFDAYVQKYFDPVDQPRDMAWRIWLRVMYSGEYQVERRIT